VWDPPAATQANAVPDSQAADTLVLEEATTVVPPTAEASGGGGTVPETATSAEEDEVGVVEVEAAAPAQPPLPPRRSPRQPRRAAAPALPPPRRPDPPPAKRARPAAPPKPAPAPPPPPTTTTLRLSKAVEAHRPALARSAAAFDAALLPRSAPPGAAFTHLVVAEGSGSASSAPRTLSWLLARAGRRPAVPPGWVAASAARGAPAPGVADARDDARPLVFAGRTVVFSRACLAGEGDRGAGLRAVAAAGGAARVAVVGAGGGRVGGREGGSVVGVTDERGRGAWADRALPPGSLVLDRGGFVEAVVRGTLM